MGEFVPVYRKLKSDELDEKIEKAYNLMDSCRLCPRECKVNRLEDELGLCRVGREAIVASYGPHFGEEPPLVGRRGSGTIFMAGCNLKCVYCQNYDISHLVYGQTVSVEKIAKFMIALQDQGCHNINFVTPTHVVPQILASLKIAVKQGLSVPLVYNCGGYESVETLKILDGVFDIYMPDVKYADDKVAQRLSKAEDYFPVVKKSLVEMHRKVGDLVLDKHGIALRGMIVRHLVLPNGLAGTDKVASFIAEEISKNTYFNIMLQYRPCYKADEYPQVDRCPTVKEYKSAVKTAKDKGLTRLAR
jgi:putative pyruvate formate lyase activating enzyme